MRKFVQLRQDLERVRNLCYMVNRREKLCRTFLRLREQTFGKQALLADGNLPAPVAAAVLEANHGPSIYDHLYSHADAEKHNYDIDSLLARIKGLESSPAEAAVSSDEKRPPQPQQQRQQQPDFNGASNKRLYFNGTVTRKKLYSSDLSSLSSSEPEQPKPSRSSAAGKAAHTDKKLVRYCFHIQLPIPTLVT